MGPDEETVEFCTITNQSEIKTKAKKNASTSGNKGKINKPGMRGGGARIQVGDVTLRSSGTRSENCTIASSKEVVQKDEADEMVDADAVGWTEDDEADGEDMGHEATDVDEEEDEHDVNVDDDDDNDEDNECDEDDEDEGEKQSASMLASGCASTAASYARITPRRATSSPSAPRSSTIVEALIWAINVCNNSL